MKSQIKNSFVFGAVLFVALLFLLFPQHLGSAPHVSLLGLVVVMATTGLALFPRSAAARPIVRREIILCASMALLGGAAMLCLSLFDCHALIAAISWHHGAGGGLMAASSAALTEEKVREFQTILRGLGPEMQKLKELPGRVLSLESENSLLR